MSAFHRVHELAGKDDGGVVAGIEVFLGGLAEGRALISLLRQDSSAVGAWVRRLAIRQEKPPAIAGSSWKVASSPSLSHCSSAGRMWLYVFNVIDGFAWPRGATCRSTS